MGAGGDGKGEGEAVMGAVGWMGGQGRDGGEGCTGMQMGGRGAGQRVVWFGCIPLHIPLLLGND